MPKTPNKMSLNQKFLISYIVIIGFGAVLFLIFQSDFVSYGQKIGDEEYEKDPAFLLAIWWYFYFGIFFLLTSGLFSAFRLAVRIFRGR